MSLSKNAKGANWKGVNLIFLLDDEHETKVHSIKAIESLCSRYNLNAQIKRIYYYKEESRELENDAAFYARISGFIGVGIVVATITCPTTTTAIARAIQIGFYVLGGGMAFAGTIAALTPECYAFHAFLVFECSEGMWISLEKNSETVCIQIGSKKDAVVNFKNGGSFNQKQESSNKKQDKDYIRGKTTELAMREAGPGFCIEDIMKWVVNSKQHENDYHVLTANCKHIAQDASNEFSADHTPLPGFVDLLLKPTMKGGKEE